MLNYLYKILFSFLALFFTSSIGAKKGDYTVAPYEINPLYKIKSYKQEEDLWNARIAQMPPTERALVSQEYQDWKNILPRYDLIFDAYLGAGSHKKTPPPVGELIKGLESDFPWLSGERKLYFNALRDAFTNPYKTQNDPIGWDLRQGVFADYLAKRGTWAEGEVPLGLSEFDSYLREAQAPKFLNSRDLLLMRSLLPGTQRYPKEWKQEGRVLRNERYLNTISLPLLAAFQLSVSEQKHPGEVRVIPLEGGRTRGRVTDAIGPLPNPWGRISFPKGTPFLVNRVIQIPVPNSHPQRTVSVIVLKELTFDEEVQKRVEKTQRRIELEKQKEHQPSDGVIIPSP